jgi:WD40 repeat protein
MSTIACHAAGFVGAISWAEGKLYSGGKDGKVVITDTSTMETIKTIEFGNLPRAIDCYDDLLVVGFRNGNIIEVKLLEDNAMKTVHESHNDGEVWGLAIDDSCVYTSGDDNQVKMWDPFSRKCQATAIVNEAARKAKKNRASTLGKHPESQCSRGLAISCNGDLAVCANDGSVTIRKLDDF